MKIALVSLLSLSLISCGVPIEDPNVVYFENTKCTLFPSDSIWNTSVDTLPVHPLSDTYITSIDAYVPGETVEIKADFGTTWAGEDIGIPYNVVAAGEDFHPITFRWWDESDVGDTGLCDTQGNEATGCYPIPSFADIEGGDDNHIILLHNIECKLYEVFNAQKINGVWQGDSGAIWDLELNEVRPIGVTSADAAGLPILPGLIRYDEIYTDKVINHVIRVTLTQIQSAYLRPPASHSDGTAGQDRTLPPMGLQLRLKADYDISSFDPNIQVILVALKKYGLIIADTGGQMFVSGTHDDRWDDDLLQELRRVKITDFVALDTGAELVDY